MNLWVTHLDLLEQGTTSFAAQRRRAWLVQCLTLLAGWLAVVGWAEAQQTVCARVGVRLSQDAVISRNAFRATLTVNNNGGEALSGVGVVLKMVDPAGVAGTTNFSGVDAPVVSGGLTSVNGTGILPSGNSGTAQWTLIPLDAAAPDAPVVYGFTGTLSYTTSEGSVNVPLDPVYLTVYPNPKLKIRYFWERDVYADDPLTLDEQEPIRPFSVGVMLTNIGKGVANNVRFTSAQPIITRNDRGLLIDFRLIGSQVGCTQVAPSLTFGLGDLPAGSTRVARWLMTSTLSGHFEDLKVRMQHLDGLGDERLSLFETPLEPPHELIHAVRDQASAADCTPDFLVSDLSPFTNPQDPFENPTDPEKLHLPDRVYLSDGTIQPVTPVFGATAATQSPVRATISAVVPPTGWFYIKLPDPAEASYQLTSLVRSDGKQIEVGTNAWQTDRVFRDNSLEPLRLNRLHIFDTGGTGIYTATYEDLGGSPQIKSWEILTTHGSSAEPVATEIPSTQKYSEGRHDAIRTLRVRFSRAIKASSLTANAVTIQGTDLDGNPISLSDLSTETKLSFDQKELTLTFSRPLPDRGRYCMTITGISDPFNNSFAQNARTVFTVLEGDAFGDRRINNSDVGAIRSLVGVPFDPKNLNHVRADINRDGMITAADVSIAISRRGIDARYIPLPCNLLATASNIKDLKGSSAKLGKDGGRDPEAGDFEAADGTLASDTDKPRKLRIARAGGSNWASMDSKQLANDQIDLLTRTTTGMMAVLVPSGMDPRRIASDLTLSDTIIMRGGDSDWWLIETTELDDLPVLADAFTRVGAFLSPVFTGDDGRWGVVRPHVRVSIRQPADHDALANALGRLTLHLTPLDQPGTPCCEFVAASGNAEALLKTAAELERVPGVLAPEVEIRWFDAAAVRSDFTADGQVDAADLSAFMAAFDAIEDRADINGDGDVDEGDIFAFFAKMSG